MKREKIVRNVDDAIVAILDISNNINEMSTEDLDDALMRIVSTLERVSGSVQAEIDGVDFAS